MLDGESLLPFTILWCKRSPPPPGTNHRETWLLTGRSEGGAEHHVFGHRRSHRDGCPTFIQWPDNPLSLLQRLTCRWSGLKLHDCLVPLINLSVVLTKSPVYRLRQMRVRHELLVLGGGYNSNDTLLSELENAWENIRPQKVEAPWQQNPVVFSSTRSSNLS